MKPSKERRDHWPAHGPVLRHQPPIRVRWCAFWNPIRQSKECESGGEFCRGRLASCPNCRFVFCEAHIDHFSGLAVPPDAWKGLYVKMARNIETSAKRFVLGLGADMPGCAALASGGRRSGPARI